MSAEDVTLGEISRNVSAIRLDLAEYRQELATRPDWQDVKRVEDGLARAAAAGDAQLLGRVVVLEGRVDKTEAWGTWGGRLVLGAVSLALLGVVLVQSPVL